MKRLFQAPNAALAHLWAAQLRAAGFDVSVQREFASGIAGQIPVDQTLPEVWIMDDDQVKWARQVFAELQNLPQRRWNCPRCVELVEGPYDQCWNCGADRPGAFAA
jgi:Putative prokaryotic signal transducing protein